MAQNAVGNLSVRMSVDLAQLKAGFAAVSRLAQQTAAKVHSTFKSGLNVAPSIAAGVRKGGAALASLAGQARNTAGGILSAFNPVSRIGSVLNMVGVAGGASLGGLATYAVKLAGELEQTQVAFRVMVGDATRANKLIGDIRQFAAATPFSSDATLAASRQMLAYGFAAEEVMPVIRQLGDVSAALNVDLNEMAYLYGTLRAQGRAYTIDIRQFALRGVPIWEELAKVMKTNVSNTKTLVEEGKVGFLEVSQAFANMTAQGKNYKDLIADLRSQAGFIGVGDVEKIAEKGLPIWKSLSRWMGRSEEKMIDMVQAGEVGFEDLAKAVEQLETAGGRFGGLLPEMSMTFMGQFNRLKDNALLTLTEFGNVLIRETPLRGWIEDGIKAIQDAKSELHNIKPEIITIVRAVGVYAKNTWHMFKQIGAGVRVAIDAFQRVFPEVSGFFQKMLTQGENFNLTWLQAKKNAIDFFESVGQFVGWFIDDMRASAGAIIEGLIVPFQKVRIEMIGMREDIRQYMPQGVEDRIFGKDPLRPILDRYETAKAAFFKAEDVWGQNVGDEDAILAKLRAQSELIQAMKAIPKYGKEMAELFELMKNEAKNADTTPEKYRQYRDELNKLQRQAMVEIFPGIRGSAERIRELETINKALEKNAKELYEPKYQNRIKDQFGAMRRELFGQEVRQNISAIQNALSSAPFTGGLTIPVDLIPDTMAINNAIDEFRMNPPRVTVEFEAKAESIHKEFVSPLAEFRREVLETADLFALGLIDMPLYDLKIAKLYEDLLSSHGGFENKRDLAAGILSDSSEAITERLKFETFGPQQQDRDVASILQQILQHEKDQSAKAARIVAALEKINLPEPTRISP